MQHPKFVYIDSDAHSDAATFDQDLQLFYTFLYKLTFEVLKILIRTGNFFSLALNTAYQYKKSHYGDKIVIRSSYFHNGISYTGKISSLYWIRVQDFSVLFH